MYIEDWIIWIWNPPATSVKVHAFSRRTSNIYKCRNFPTLYDIFPNFFKQDFVRRGFFLDTKPRNWESFPKKTISEKTFQEVSRAWGCYLLYIYVCKNCVLQLWSKMWWQLWKNRLWGCQSSAWTWSLKRFYDRKSKLANRRR